MQKKLQQATLSVHTYDLLPLYCGPHIGSHLSTLRGYSATSCIGMHFTSRMRDHMDSCTQEQDWRRFRFYVKVAVLGKWLNFAQLKGHYFDSVGNYVCKVYMTCYRKNNGKFLNLTFETFLSNAIQP